MVRPKLNKRVARAMHNIDEFFVGSRSRPSFRGSSGRRYRPIPVDRGSDGRECRTVCPGGDAKACYQFRITRDADIEIREAEAQDLLEEMEQNLKQRRFGDVVRLEVSSSMPAEMVNYLTESLESGEDVCDRRPSEVHRCI